jgi:hypothetical protein
MSCKALKFFKSGDSKKKEKKRIEWFENQIKKQNRSQTKKNYRTGHRNFETKNVYTDADLLLQIRNKKQEKLLSEKYNSKFEQCQKEFSKREFDLFINQNSLEYKNAREDGELDGKLDVEFAYWYLYHSKTSDDTFEQYGYPNIKPPIVFIY